MAQWENPFPQKENSLCEKSPQGARSRVLESVQWDPESPGLLDLEDEHGSVEEEMKQKCGLNCFAGMQVCLYSTSGCQVVHC